VQSFLGQYAVFYIEEGIQEGNIRLDSNPHPATAVSIDLTMPIDH
jgi:hypothetical protein